MGLSKQLKAKLDRVRGLTMPAECRALAELARQANGPIVELGSHTGLSTLWLALGSGDGNGWGVHACDPFLGPRPDSEDDPFGLGDDVEEEFRRNLDAFGVSEVVAVHVMTSTQLAEQWVPEVGDEPVGMLFIDAVHEEWAIREDFLAWDPKMKLGATLALHDFSDSYPGTQVVVDDTILASKRYEELVRPDGKTSSLWVGRKTR